MIPKYAYDKLFTVRFPDSCEWKDEGGLIWYTDSCKASGSTGPEAACGTSIGVAMAMAQDLKQPVAPPYELPRGRSGTGQSEATGKGTQTGKATHTGTLCQQANELLKVNRHQLQWVAGLLKGLGPVHSLRCERRISHTHPVWLWGNIPSHDTLCDCEATFCHMSHYFMEPWDYHDAPIMNILCFIRSEGLTEGWTRRGRTTDLWGHSARAAQSSDLHLTFIHTYKMALSHKTKLQLSHT
jgi:hypothetical protein